MKNSIAVTSALLLTFFAISCKNGDSNATTSTATAAAVKLPNTPEEVVKTWENQIGQNQFADAKLISIGKTLETVVSLDSTNRIEHIAPSSTKILSIACKTTDNKSECDCILEDAVGQLKCTYYLVQQNGQWYLQDADSAPIETPKESKLMTTNKKPEHPTK